MELFSIRIQRTFQLVSTGNDYIRVTVEIDGRKIAVWTTESNINALRFDIDKKR